MPEPLDAAHDAAHDAAEVHPSLRKRKIVHVDMDAFYASIEVRENPALRGKPVIVGGDPQGRGVVATASYEARKYGVHSAMPAARARRLCPHGIFLRPRFELYCEASQAIREVFRRHTALVEPLSLDEAYLDVTANALGLSATEVARRVKQEIREATGLTGSAGVAPNKMVAKIASDLEKPDGLTVVRPEAVAAFVRELAVRKIPGIGEATARRLKDLKIVTCKEALAFGAARLEVVLGRAGLWLYERCQGIDPRPVESGRSAKSIGQEDTFERDLDDPDEIRRSVLAAAARVAERLRAAEMRGRTIVLKVRYADFTTITRSVTTGSYTDDAGVIGRAALDLLARTEAGARPVRLLGVTVSHLDNQEPTDEVTVEGRQLLLAFFR